jgi:hypothetical protein
MPENPTYAELTVSVAKFAETKAELALQLEDTRKEVVARDSATKHLER